MSAPIDPQNVFVVIPVFNEQQSLQLTVDQLIAKNYNLVVVDDCSDIPTRQLLKNRKIFFLKHRINLGQGAALQTGIEFALSRGAYYIVTFDADGQHNTNDIEKMLHKLHETRSDIILGSRFMKNNSVPFSRRILLQAGRYINYFFTGVFLTDAHNGLRVMTRKAAEQMRIRENRMAHATEILSLIRKNKLKYVEAPVDVFYTEYSRNKGQTAMSSFRILFDLLLNKIFR